jgi:hypothetical protein
VNKILGYRKIKDRVFSIRFNFFIYHTDIQKGKEPLKINQTKNPKNDDQILYQNKPLRIIKQRENDNTILYQNKPLRIIKHCTNYRAVCFQPQRKRRSNIVPTTEPLVFNPSQPLKKLHTNR